MFTRLNISFYLLKVNKTKANISRENTGKERCIKEQIHLIIIIIIIIIICYHNFIKSPQSNNNNSNNNNNNNNNNNSNNNNINNNNNLPISIAHIYIF